MNPTYELISEQTLNSNQANIIFYNIPQTFKDLIITFSARSANTSASIADNVRVRFNDFSSDTNHTARYVYSSGSTTSAGTDTFARFGYANSNLTTSNCFANNEVYIPNYTSSITKIFTCTSVIETIAAASDMTFSSGFYNSTNPITSMILYTGSGSNFMSGTSFQLYGIKGADDGSRGYFGPAMAGGDEVYTTGNGYKVHVFKNSGTLNVTAPGEVEYLVIGGGGAGGYFRGGGGGAGGYRSSAGGENSGGGANTEKPLLLNSGIYSIIIGAGGSGGLTAGNKGGDTYFYNITSLGGGGGSGGYSSPTSGGSGGGGGAGGVGAGLAGGAGVSGQGYAGGSGNAGGGNFAGLGGGGAGAAGVSGGGDGTCTAGGAGVASLITGSSIFRAAGGGGSNNISGCSGGSSIGGNGGTSPTSGSINTGSGGGGSNTNTVSGANGGSGIVIIRYRI